MHIYVYMYVCMYIYIYLFTYLYIYIYINICICMYIYVCVCVYIATRAALPLLCVRLFRQGIFYVLMFIYCGNVYYVYLFIDQSMDRSIMFRLTD